MTAGFSANVATADASPAIHFVAQRNMNPGTRREGEAASSAFISVRTEPEASRARSGRVGGPTITEAVRSRAVGESPSASDKIDPDGNQVLAKSGPQSILASAAS
jgi:hypothetical protein